MRRWLSLEMATEQTEGGWGPWGHRCRLQNRNVHRDTTQTPVPSAGFAHGPPPPHPPGRADTPGVPFSSQQVGNSSRRSVFSQKTKRGATMVLRPSTSFQVKQGRVFELPLIRCVALGKLLNFSVPRLSPLLSLLTKARDIKHEAV